MPKAKENQSCKIGAAPKAAAPTFLFRFVDSGQSAFAGFPVLLPQIAHGRLHPTVPVCHRPNLPLNLCDFVRTETGCRWKLPLEGEFDFDGLFTELHAAGYRGPAFIEVYSDAYTDTTALYDCYRKLAGEQ